MAEGGIMARYSKRFAKLRTNVDRVRWSEFPRNRAPHKPLLLLSVLDLFDQSRMTSNFIGLSPDVGELFARYWARAVSPDRQGRLFLPFFHLHSDGFWRLLPRPGKENILASTKQIGSLNQLRDAVIGARLDDELYELLQEPGPRSILRTVLIETYFAPEARPALTEQGAINDEAFRYSERLLRQDYGAVAEVLTEEEAYRPPARDQGFRRAVVTAYDHRCALCGVRVLTFDGHTAVDASHIEPWSSSRDDRPANGIALCKLCHWSFDEGLLGVSRHYTVMSSAELAAPNNLPGHLSSLKGRGIVGPAERAHWPDPGSLKWHRKNVFRTW
jgi:putative restriction endonuclease